MMFFFKHKTAYDLRISDWSSDVCSSDLMSCIAITCMTIGSRPDRWRRLEPPWTPRSSFSLHADRAAVSHPVARRLMSKNHPITACCQNENGGQSQHGSIILNPMGEPPCRQTNLLR